MIPWPSSWPPWRVLAGLSFGLVATGWAAGLWCGVRWATRREDQPQLLTVGHGKPTPARDLSPASSPRSIVAAGTTPGVPPAPPVPVPRELGEQVKTSRVDLPPNVKPITVELATFARIEGQRLLLQDVAWTTGPGAPVPLKVETIERAAPLPLPPAPRIPRWEASLLLAPSQGRIAYGAELSRAWGRGPIVTGIGAHPGGVYLKAGWRW